jgi:hypothetical protein
MSDTSSDGTERSIKYCTRCSEAFWIGKHDDYGDVLDHWAKEHNDLEECWRFLNDVKCWARCGGCGEMFVTIVRPSQRGLVVSLYCDDCADNGLEDKIKALMVDDVTGQYVLENEVCDKEGCA